MKTVYDDLNYGLIFKGDENPLIIQVNTALYEMARKTSKYGPSPLMNNLAKTLNTVTNKGFINMSNETSEGDNEMSEENNKTNEINIFFAKGYVPINKTLYPHIDFTKPFHILFTQEGVTLHQVNNLKMVDPKMGTINLIDSFLDNIKDEDPEEKIITENLSIIKGTLGDFAGMLCRDEEFVSSFLPLVRDDILTRKKFKKMLMKAFMGKIEDLIMTNVE